MTILNIGTKFFGLEPGVPYLAGAAATMDASGEKCALIMTVANSLTVRYIKFRTGTVTTGDTIKASIQGINSSGDPDGTIKGASNNCYGTVVVADGDDNVWKTVDLGEANTYATTIGERLAIVLEFNSYVAGNLAIYTNTPTTVPILQGHLRTYASSAWSTLGVIPSITLSDGSAYLYNTQPGVITTLSFSSSTTPDEAGLYFSLPYSYRVIGFWWFQDMDQDTTVKFYGSSTVTFAAKAAERRGTSSGLMYAMLATPQTLDANTAYRITLLPDGSSAYNLRYYDLIENAALASTEMGQATSTWYYTSRSDAGAWTETNTRMIACGPIIDQIIVPDAAGGGNSVIGSGIIRALEL